jgi:hypothetical protein
MNDPKAIDILREHERMKSERATYRAAWDDIRNLVRPNTVDFDKSNSPGDVRTERIYDGTAMQSNLDLGNAVHTFLINPSERNFGIKVSYHKELNEDPDVVKWMDKVSEIIAAEYMDDRTMFTSSVQECFLDLGAFGNVILNQEFDYDNWHLSFKACPLANSFFDENKNGHVDKFSREMDMTVRQVLQQFPDATWEGKENDKPEKKYCVVHKVYPRSDRQYGREDGPNMPYASCWVLKEKKVILSEGGYRSFPYHVGRWSKSDEETYGRGPAINCLPEIRMLNRMEFTIIKAWQKAVDPALIMPSDGFLSKFKTAPGSINFKDTSVGEFEVQTLEHKGKLEGAETKSDQKRDFIRQCFYADWVKLMPKKERQTAYEISELVEQQLRMMAPLLGRLQSEFVVPCIQRSYDLLLRAGMFPEPPSSLAGLNIEVDYVSASARAQSAKTILDYSRLLQNIAVIQPIAPEVTDYINLDNVAKDMAIKSGVPAGTIRSEEDVAEIRNSRAQAQQAQQMAEIGETVSKAALNVSQANQAGQVV